jgi:hypothetical protein
MSSDQLWYLLTNGNWMSAKISPTDSCTHKGHASIDSTAMNPGAKSLTEEERDIHKNMEDAGIQLPEQAFYLSQVTGHTWTSKQMRHLSNSEKDQVSSLTADASSADHLVESFQAW